MRRGPALTAAILGLGLVAAWAQTAPTVAPQAVPEVAPAGVPEVAPEAVPQFQSPIAPEAAAPVDAQIESPIPSGAAPQIESPIGAAPEAVPEVAPQIAPETGDIPGEVNVDTMGENPALPDQAQATAADPASLAAMRADLAALGKALQSLRAELRASGPAGFAIAGGTGAIDRMDRMEVEIARLTGEVEAMRNRVEAAITEGSTRAGDIEFRLCEMEPGCDLGALTTSQLDAAVDGAPDVPAPDLATPMPTPIPGTVPPDGTAAPSGEAADMDRARQAAAAGDHASAAQLFGAFATDHPGSPLAPEALYLQGEALAAAGDGPGAANAWLQAFTANPAGDHAAASLLGLADVMAKSGKTEDACLFLTDVPARFPGTPAALEAVSRAEAQGCPAAVPAAPADGAAMDPEAAADLADGD
ncbi:hypothetical protein DRW48_05060 [Paracoccus suum]|uniref:Cell division coordinator CpoB n=1 Tax=Paracoccus suum TaxID=2259340 RepID=A0A344PIC8_9RHOB|nr:tetratricopeptide repeat protein [Paracoccus suum]AXC49133.1 hypothetical protein DRW48_05060 [Paracoccus suum]